MLKMPIQRQNDIPVPTGPLRLSVYRQSSPEDITTSNYDVTQKYSTIFESFVKRRPLSESFACIRDITSYDFSSSSDEELSDPIPESPLNLSDTDSMETSQDATPLATRRRKFFQTTPSKNTRPKSLYDSAKPRPPSTDKKTSKGVGDRLSRLKWPWRSAGVRTEDLTKSSYMRSFEPTPDEWSNVVSPTSQRLQPRPPATSPTHPVPSPRKKRHAPKPPTNIAPFLPKDNESMTDSVTHVTAPKTSDEMNFEPQNEQEKLSKTSPTQNNGPIHPPISERVKVPSSAQEKNTEDVPDSILPQDLERIPLLTSDSSKASSLNEQTKLLGPNSPTDPLVTVNPSMSENTQNLDRDGETTDLPILCQESTKTVQNNKKLSTPLGEALSKNDVTSQEKKSQYSFETDKMTDLPSFLTQETVQINEKVFTPLGAPSSENERNPQDGNKHEPQNLEQVSTLTQDPNKHIIEPIISPVIESEVESELTQSFPDIAPKIPLRKNKHNFNKTGAHSDSKINRNVTMSPDNDDCDVIENLNLNEPNIPLSNELDSASCKSELVSHKNMQLERAKFLELSTSTHKDVEETVQIVVRYLLKTVEEMATAKSDSTTKNGESHNSVPSHKETTQQDGKTATNIPTFVKDNDARVSAPIKHLQKISAGDVTMNQENDVTETDDAMNVFDDVITSTVALRDTPRDETHLHKTTKHRKSVDNASSGYSSPGSGDEGPTSPRPAPSLTSLSSPTSSYYSTSLSASSSRVSDLSRELALAKSPIQEVNIDEVQTNTKTDSNKETQELPQAVDNKDPDTRDRSISSNVTCEDNIEVTKSESKTENEGIKHTNTGIEVVKLRSVSEGAPAYDPLPNKPISLRHKTSTNRVRAKSEYIPYRADQEEDWQNELSRVSICMIEKPSDTTGSLSRSQARLFKPSQSRAPSKKKTLAAQKSRAFAMRAKPHWHRHSYAESSPYIVDETDSAPTVPSSNLVSHFVSTQNISTYYDGIEQKQVSPQEILTTKREEFFNAFKVSNIDKNSEKFGGSVRHLPVSSKEFGFANDIIHEVSEIDSPVKSEVFIPPTQDNKENLVQRQHSGASSTGSSNHCSSQSSSVYAGSTWSLSTDMASQARLRKPSLRRRLQGAFSFQNIRKAMSMEKLNDDEKRRSMSHHYLNENGVEETSKRQRSATIDVKTPTNNNNVPTDQTNLRKAPSISSIFSSVAMRKRKSRTRTDNTNRYTIADPENFAKNAEMKTESKRSTLRPVSMILSNANKRKLEDVGSPAFFRPIGRVLQMNPAEGTLLVEMVKPSSGPFGFYIARKKESGDSGSVFISRLSDSYPDKMFAGLMRTGDEITEVNGKNVAKLSLNEVYDLILDSDRTLLKLKPAQVHVV